MKLETCAQCGLQVHVPVKAMKSCVGCGVTHSATEGRFCGECQEKIRPRKTLICDLCGGEYSRAGKRGAASRFCGPCREKVYGPWVGRKKKEAVSEQAVEA